MKHQLQSRIDWNELFPLLSQKVREDAMLEAIQLLTSHQTIPFNGGNGGNGNRIIPVLPHRHRKPKAARHWNSYKEQNNIEGRLCQDGRKYRINRNAQKAPQSGDMGKFWKGLIDSKGEIITFEGATSLWSGDRIMAGKAIWTLWATNCIDLAM